MSSRSLKFATEIPDEGTKFQVDEGIFESRREETERDEAGLGEETLTSSVPQGTDFSPMLAQGVENLGQDQGQ